MPEVTPLPGSRLITFRNAFFSGVLLLAPLIVTVWAFRAFIDVVGGRFRPWYEHYLPESLQQLPFFWDVVATGVVILLVTGLGLLSNYFLGKYFLSMGERAILRIPGIGTVYSSVKQVVATFGAGNRNMFTKVVVVEFPRRGTWSMGFLTNTVQGEPQSVAGSEVWTIFVPTAPNPTSGFMVMFPRHEVVELTMSVGDGMKMIVSGGAVVPPWTGAKPVTLPS